MTAFSKKKRDSGKTPTPSISPTEWEVMKALWSNGPMAARDVNAALPKDLGWSYETVRTLLFRLRTKGALEVDRIGNSYLYKPACDREQITRKEISGLLRRIMDGSLAPALAYFIEDHDLSEAEIDELRTILDRKSKNRKKAKED